MKPRSRFQWNQENLQLPPPFSEKILCLCLEVHFVVAAWHSSCSHALSVCWACTFIPTVSLQVSYGGNKRCSLYSQLDRPEPLFENQSSSIILFILHFCHFCIAGFIWGTRQSPKYRSGLGLTQGLFLAKYWTILPDFGIFLVSLWRKILV